MRKDSAIHQIAVVALPQVVAFDLAIPMQVFGHEDQAEQYRVRLCGPAPGAVPTTSGFPIGVTHGLGVLRSADTVIVPGFALSVPVPLAVRRALASAHRRGARMASICTGAFALAGAGILDGRPATTHWHHCTQLAEQFPAVSVDPRVLYVDDGRVLTSAGMLAGLDLCLHMVARDQGEAAAVAVARRMVAPLHRSGGQAQFIPGGPAALPTGPTDVSETLRWAQTHLDQPLTVSAMARHAVLSTRTFHRAVRAQTGSSPHDWLTRARLGAACALLEDPSVSVDEVARRSGLGTGANLRMHFRRTFATTPSAYRSTFVG